MTERGKGQISRGEKGEDGLKSSDKVTVTSFMTADGGQGFQDEQDKSPRATFKR
ncbi:MAG: hypothetical protein AAGJ18_23515 [Bacteroidota bacterium]